MALLKFEALNESNVAVDAGVPAALANPTFQPLAVVEDFSIVLSARSFTSEPSTADVTVIRGVDADTLLISIST